MNILYVLKFERNVFVSYILILLFALLVCSPMLGQDQLYGHSIQWNLVWVRNFTAQLLQGDLYPRWLMDMNYGGGSPAFYYYAPFPFYVTAIPGLIFPGIKLTTQLVLGEWLLIAFSGLTFFHFARRRCAVVPALIGAMLYMVLPYHFEIDLWLRQDIGELANYIWMPLALYYSEKLFDGEEAIAGLAVTYSLLMLSHLPSALLFSIALGCYVFVLAWQRRAWRFLPHFAAAIAIGILLAGIYWVPALFTLQYVHNEYLWGGYFDFHLWFLPPRGDFQFPAFFFRLFDVLCLTSAIFVLCWLNVFRWRKSIDIQLMSRYLMLFGVAWFLMSPWSLFIWESVPELSKVQFPWRIAMVVDLATALVVLFTINSIYLHRDRISILCTAIALGLLFYSFTTYDAKLASVYAPIPEGMPHFLKEGIDAPEYMSRWVSQDFINLSNQIRSMGKSNYDPEELDYDLAKGRVSVIAWKPRRIILNINFRESTVISVRQLYFPNWRARIIGGAALNVQPSPITGLIQVLAPAGNYKLVLRLEPQIHEKIGAALSGLALLILIGRFWLRRRLRKTSVSKSASS